MVEALDAHRAALIWRNFLVRKDELHQTYEARVALSREIRAASITSDERGTWTHLTTVLDDNPEDMKVSLLHFLRTEYIVPLAVKVEANISIESLVRLKQEFAQNLFQLDGMIKVLQSQHRIHRDIPDILQKLEGLHVFENGRRGLDIHAAYAQYLKHNAEAVQLKQRVDELLRPFSDDDAHT